MNGNDPLFWIAVGIVGYMLVERILLWVQGWLLRRRWNKIK